MVQAQRVGNGLGERSEQALVDVGTRRDLLADQLPDDRQRIATLAEHEVVDEMAKTRPSGLEGDGQGAGDTDEQPSRAVGAEHGTESGDERGVEQHDRRWRGSPTRETGATRRRRRRGRRGYRRRRRPLPQGARSRAARVVRDVCAGKVADAVERGGNCADRAGQHAQGEPPGSSGPRGSSRAATAAAVGRPRPARPGRRSRRPARRRTQTPDRGRPVQCVGFGHNRRAQLRCADEDERDAERVTPPGQDRRADRHVAEPEHHLDREPPVAPLWFEPDIEA